MPASRSPLADLLADLRQVLAEANRVLPLVHARTRIPVDVVLAGPGLEELFFARAEQRPIGDVTVPVACAEDVVTMKVLAGRAKDLDDVAAILRAQRGTLDLYRARERLRQIERALTAVLTPPVETAAVPA